MVYIYHVKISEDDMRALEVMRANIETVKNTISDIKKSFPNSWNIPLHTSILKDKYAEFNLKCENIVGLKDLSKKDTRIQYRISPLDLEILIYSNMKIDIKCDKIEVK